MARDAQAVVAVGAQALHIHPRNAEGKQSLAYQDVAAALSAIHMRCPDISVGVSTGIWIEPGVSLRLQRIKEWTVLPDFVSVNFSEPGVADLCTTLLARGIGIEAGISTVAEVQLLLKLGLADRCLRILIEPTEEETHAALANTIAIISVLDEAHVQLPCLLHGSDATIWPVLHVALQRGYDTRIGLEDTLTLPDGNQAQGNAELVSLAVRYAKSV